MNFLDKTWWLCNSLQLSDLGSVFEVGIGLYLGLAIIQAISAGNVSNVQRKVTILESAIKKNKKTTLHDDLNRLKNDSSVLEDSIHNIHRLVASIVLFLLAVSIIGLIVSTFIGDLKISFFRASLIHLYYLILPPLIFFIVVGVVRYRCKPVNANLKSLNTKYNALLRK